MSENEPDDLENEEEEIRQRILNRKSFISKKPVCWVFMGVFAVWLLGSIPLLIHGPDAKAGVTGDAFGTVNALFSGLAFAGVVLALIAQREDLWHQRQEIQLALLESKRSRMEYEKMARAQETQVEWHFRATYLEALNQRIDTIRKLAEADRDAGRTTRHWSKEAFALSLYIGDVFDELRRESYPLLGTPPRTSNVYENLLWLSDRLCGHLEGYASREYKLVIEAVNHDLAYIEGCVEYIRTTRSNLELLQNKGIDGKFHSVNLQTRNVGKALDEAKTSQNKDVMEALEKQARDLRENVRIFYKGCSEME